MKTIIHKCTFSYATSAFFIDIMMMPWHIEIEVTTSFVSRKENPFICLKKTGCPSFKDIFLTVGNLVTHPPQDLSFSTLLLPVTRASTWVQTGPFNFLGLTSVGIPIELRKFSIAAIYRLSCLIHFYSTNY